MNSTFRFRVVRSRSRLKFKETEEELLWLSGGCHMSVPQLPDQLESWPKLMTQRGLVFAADIQPTALSRAVGREGAEDEMAADTDGPSGESNILPAAFGFERSDRSRSRGL